MTGSIREKPLSGEAQQGLELVNLRLRPCLPPAPYLSY